MSVSVGIDLNDDYLIAYNYENKSMLSVPTVISRDKKEDVWRIGEDAYRTALGGTGVLTDRLITLLKKGGTSTVARKAYTAVQLISRLIRASLDKLMNGADLSDISCLAIAVRNAEAGIFESVAAAAELAGISRDRLILLSYQEAFIHYTMAQEKEFSYNMVGLFDLSADEFSFYNMKVIRGTGRMCVTADGEDIEEKFRLGILADGQGSELGDRLMLDAAKKYIGSGVYSAVFLTGKGFERTDWAGSFIEYICRRRRVIYENGLFAIGAAIRAWKQASASEDGYLIFCDTRTDAEVSIKVSVNNKISRLIMIPAGAFWFSADTYAEVIPSGQKFIDIDIEPAERNKPRKNIRIPLTGFPERPEKCSRFSVRVRCKSARELDIGVTDLGFGEFFESSGITVKESITL